MRVSSCLRMKNFPFGNVSNYQGLAPHPRFKGNNYQLLQIYFWKCQLTQKYERKKKDEQLRENVFGGSLPEHKDVNE